MGFYGASARTKDSAGSSTTSLEWIYHFHARLSEVACISCGNGEVVLKRGGGNHSIMLSIVSVRSSGWNQPFTGQASSSFTSPSLRRRSLRLRRISAGRMIWPFVETVVRMPGKILSYEPNVNVVVNMYPQSRR